jgi:hypothetical protein
MDRESVERLRFDTRLARRRDWVEDTAVEQYLDALPDVAPKMTTVGELEAEGGAAKAGATPEPSPAGLGGAPAPGGEGSA